ncbi:heme exporter protein CcmD [Psychrobacter sp. YP14]|jgi:heme exporter protein D|uniref:Heme exporter protein D n=2 Tax=Psychrobacter TaxID=497 RepID=A0A844M131_9GAMM|nr:MULTISPECIES: heme exporter protein CcmD [Psychrobacter]AWT49870.1 heme exporter protein CcmD [Psychrobacter sp. YP14]MUG32669.1 heme exporter protein CcmD [Psychrobacter sanguinis]
MQPYFYSFQEFLAMGKHGMYVWSTWGLTLIVVLGFVLYSVHQRRQLVKDLKIQHTRQQQRKQAQRRP